MSTKEKETGFEKTIRIIVNVGAIVIMFIALGYFYWWGPTCAPGDLDKEFMSCRADWSDGFDKFGTILFCLSCLWLSGNYKYVIKTDDEDPLKQITTLAWIAGIAGCLMVYFL